MRKFLALFCCLMLVLLAGCDHEDPATPATAAPSVNTAQPKETLPPETTEAPTEPGCGTVALRSKDAALRKSYVLIPISSDAPFLAQGVKLNESGADALAQWLMTADAQAMIVELGVEEFGEAIFTMPEDTLHYAGKISKSTAKS